MADTARHPPMLVRAAFAFSTWRPATLDIDRRTTIPRRVFHGGQRQVKPRGRAGRAGRLPRGAGRRPPAWQPPVGPGGLFHELFLRARPEQKTVLTEIIRQREAWAREAVEQIGRGEPAEVRRANEPAGRRNVPPTRDDAERRLIERWREGGVTNPHDNRISPRPTRRFRA